MKRLTLALGLCAWVLWVQTRTSGPGQPVTDAWHIVDTFPNQQECERARVTIEPPTAEGRARPPIRTRYVCFPDTHDPQATP
jgi:hypothetical protein